MISEHRYRLTRPDSPLDLMIHVEMAPTAYAWRHTRLVAWGIDGRGRKVRRESRDPAAIKAFVARIGKERRGPKARRLEVESVWSSLWQGAAELKPSDSWSAAGPR